MTHLPLALAGGHAGTAIAIAIAQRAITFHCPLPILAWSHPPPPTSVTASHRCQYNPTEMGDS